MQRFEEHGVPIKEFGKERLEEWEERVAEANNIVLVLKTAGEIAGYIYLKKTPKFPDDTSYVDTLWVIKKYQGKGLAQNLVECGIDEAKGAFNAKKILSHVVQENKPAVKFWQKAGFKQIGEPKLREAKWDGKESSYLTMIKNLEE